MSGVAVGGANVSCVRYGDDALFIVKSESEFHSLIQVIRVSEIKKLNFNIKTQDTRGEGHLKGQELAPLLRCTISGKCIQLNNVESINFLGILITTCKMCITENKHIIAQAETIQKLESIICSKSLFIRFKQRVLHCDVKPILFCGQVMIYKETGVS